MFEMTWAKQSVWGQMAAGDAIAPPPPDHSVPRVVPLLWREHCVECAIPHCYQTCPLFVSRADNRCARFVYGIAANPAVKGFQEFGADICFRRWAKLAAFWPQDLSLVPIDTVRRYAALTEHLEKPVKAVASLLSPFNPGQTANQAYSHFRERLGPTAGRGPGGPGDVPDGLYLKFWSPVADGLGMHIEIVQDRVRFRTSVRIARGWNEFLLNLGNLEMDPALPGSVRLWLENDDDVRLVFTWLNLVRLGEVQKAGAPQPGKPLVPAATVKCVAWDLDNTLWEGVIGDSGPDGVVVNDAVLGLIRQLDERGIIQTIVSKNEHEIAWQKIASLGMADYFIFPAINWDPKSQNLRKVADALNINLDTFALIDDSDFERREVSVTLPQVRVFDPANMDSLLDLPEFDVVVSSETKQRRLSYLAEAKRKEIAEEWSDDYDSFLADCGMTVCISRPDEEAAVRCLELLQRSNQFKLSKVRYNAAQLDELLASPDHECFCFSVADKYGAYGTVGFAVVRIGMPEPVVEDFVMSCRVAMKKVDDAFLLWLALRYRLQGATCLGAAFTVTDRNKPLARVLEKLEFRVISAVGPDQHLALDLDTPPAIPPFIVMDDRSGDLRRGRELVADRVGS